MRPALKWILLLALLLAMSPDLGSATVTTLYVRQASTTGDWTNVPAGVIGLPDTTCNLSSTENYSINTVARSEAFLTATSFEPFVPPPHEYITAVEVDVWCLYDTTEQAAPIEFLVSGPIDPIVKGLPNSRESTRCGWRGGLGWWNIIDNKTRAPWTKEDISKLRVEVRRSGESANVRIDALCIRVTTERDHESPEITLISPNGGESWPLSSPQIVRWVSSRSLVNVKLELSLNNGISFNSLADSLTGTSYQWTVSNASQTTQALIRVAGTDTTGPDLTISDKSNASFTITSPPPLGCSAKSDATIGRAPLRVEFSGLATFGTPPYAYDWTFGDGAPFDSTKAMPNSVHIYQEPGSYSALLQVTDDDGTVCADVVNIRVGSDTALVCSARGRVVSRSENPVVLSGPAPLQIAFSGSAVGGISNNYYFTWLFGDGAYRSGQDVIHEYTAAKEYDVVLIATDDSGRQDTSTLHVAVTKLACVADAQTSALKVYFNASATSGLGPYHFLWDFGDGSTSQEQNPVHEYATAGRYRSKVTVYDARSSDSLMSDTCVSTIDVVVSSLRCFLYADRTIGADSLLEVEFTPSAVGGWAPYTFDWEFGDGTTATTSSNSDPNARHIYKHPGHYLAHVRAVDSETPTASTISDDIAIDVVEMISLPYRTPGIDSVSSFSCPVAAAIEGGSALRNYAATELFGPVDTTKWRVYHWSPKDKGYISVETFKPGRGYWVASRRSSPLKLRGLTYPQADFVDSLESGPHGEEAWNQIGNPFNFAVAADSIRVASGGVTYKLGDTSNKLTSLEILVRKGNDYVATKVFAPMSAAWIQKIARGKTVNWILPARELLAPPPPAPELPADASWGLVVAGWQHGTHRSEVLLGAADVPKDGWNPLSRSAPPAILGGGLTLRLLKTDWGRKNGLYLSEFQPQDSVMTWSIHAEGSALPEEFELVVQPVRLPSGARIWLRDHLYGSRQEVVTGERTAWNTGPDGRNFELAVDFRGTLGPLPSRLETASLPPSPNPFADRTSLQFRLEQTADLRVTIFDISGRRIRQFSYPKAPAGEHAFVWDGRDDLGRKSPSGLFIARVTVNSEISSYRMVKLR